MNIIPAILEKDFDEIKKKYDLVKDLCETVQIDIADGLFVDNTTFMDFERLEDLVGTASLDVHFMANDLYHFINKRVNNVKSISLHAESVDFGVEMLGQFWLLGYKVGVSINPETPLTVLEECMDKVDYVQFLGVTPGKQGNSFQDSVLDKIKEFKDMYPDVEIWVDGGLNDETLPKLLNLGVDNAVIGSAIFGSSDPVSKLKEYLTAYGNK